MKTYQRSLLIFGITSLTFLVMFISFGEAQNRKRSADKDSAAGRKTNIVAPPLRNVRELLKNRKSNTPGSPASLPPVTDGLEPYSASAVAFIETPAVRDLTPVTQSREELAKSYAAREDREKNESNTKRVKPLSDPSMTGPFVDPTLSTRFDRDGSKSGRSTTPLVVTNPLQNFDGPDMDQGAILFGGRFAPPDTNAAVGPNHVVITCNAGFQIFTKAGVALTPLTKISR
jgi:hypothetical protein